jgi:LPXTG-motif cell wall-anchored protein
MRTTIAAGAAMLVMIGVSTVVEAQSDEEAAPPAADEGGAPPPTTIEIVVTVPDPDAASATDADPAAQADGAGNTAGDDETAVTTTTAAPATTPGDTASSPSPASSTTTPTTDVAAPTTTAPVVRDAPGEAAGTPGETASTTTAPAPTGPVASSGATHTADQQTVINGTQVAVAVSGSNGIVTEQPPSGAPAANTGADVATGDAAAIGSRDDNTITQEAAVVLSGDAIARVLQIALILNIGAAFANTGSNTITATGAGDSTTGQVTSGDATAIGNEIASYVTQAASTEASSAIDDSTSQQALSLFLGLAIADSGMNTVSGTGQTGSGGGIDTGGATAIGNDSLTSITQQAIALGSGGATLDIRQRATVLNLGFALANSGLNEISGVAGSMLAASDEQDDALAEELFAMLLPALLDSYGYGVGSGSVATGDATAIGNQSETYVQQVARATASGDGTATIDQEVVIANVGAAGANTGGNVLGGTTRTLDPQAAKAVVTMAAFLAQLLSMVHNTPSSATTLARSSQTIEIPFGDLVLQLDGRFDALDTTVGQGGTRADVRQVSIVLSLGVAHADSGRNTTEVVSTTQLLAAVNAVLPEIVRTGDARAANRALVVICQRSNAADVPCLAPPVEEPASEEPPAAEPPAVAPQGGSTQVSTVAPPAPPSAVPVRTLVPAPTGPARPQAFRAPSTTRQLPATGSDTQTIILIGALLVLAGGCLLVGVGGRRTRSRAESDLSW